MQQAPTYGIHRGAKPQHLADGGFVKAIKGLVSSIADNRKPDEAPVGTGAAAQAKTALTTRKQALDDAEKKAVGMAHGGAVRKSMKAGGEVPGSSPTPTADNIPINGTAGEFMIRQPAAEVLGKKVLTALNSLGGDMPTKGGKAKGYGATREPLKMYGGGSVADELARAREAEYLNRNPTPRAAPVAPDLTTSPGAAAPNNNVRFAVPPEPIAATTSPGAAPVQAPTQPRIAPQSAVKFAGDPLYPNAIGPAPAPATAPAAVVAPAPPRADAAVRGAGFTVTEPPKPQSLAQRALGAVRGTAGPATLIAGAIPEQLDVARVAANPNTTKNDVLAQQATGVGRYASAAAGALGGAAIGGMTGPAAPILAPVGAILGGAYGYYAGNKALEGARGAAGVDTRAPVDQLPVDPSVAAQPNRAAPATAPSGPAAPAYPETAGMHTLAPQTPNPNSALPVLGQAGKEVGPGINRYDVPGKSPLFSNLTGPEGQRSNEALLNRAPITAQNQGALDGIQARQDAAQQGRANKETYDAQVADAQAANQFELDKNLRAAALGTPSYRGSKAIAPSKAAQGIYAQQQTAKAEEAKLGIARRGQDLDAARALASQKGSDADRKLARDKFDLDAKGANLDNEGKAEMSALRKVLIDPKATKEQKDAAATSVRALLGKNDLPPVREFAVPGGQVVDALGNVTTQPSRVYDPSTKSFISPQDQGAALPPGMVRQVGTANGRPVYIDKNGKQVIAKAP